MTLRLKPASPPASPFSWGRSSPSPPLNPAELSSPPTIWLSARDMKLFGVQPLTSTSDIGLVRCRECEKPVLRSYIGEHADNCEKLRAAPKKAAKGKGGLEVEDPKKGSKKRKASPTPDDPSAPAKKKSKPAPKITKGRIKGPVDLDRHCGVINDKNLPCSRALTCKSHSMGAKRAVLGRSRNYDELLLDWQRANNPNFVEPVKRETKAEKKEKKEREKKEKKEQAMAAAVAAGLDPSAIKKSTSSSGTSKKVSKKAAAAAAAAAAVRAADPLAAEEAQENLDDVDSEAEVDDLVKAIRISREKGIVGVPLALPCDAGTWFVQRREKSRCCRDLLLNALGHGGGSAVNAANLGMGGLGMGLPMQRAGSLGISGMTLLGNGH
ncbi:hypothetical protein PLEOSDRAFT_1066313 [Pleurotus ostreatus PC15]|uniref:SCA7 domain-containing protein n=1 Tax=Pleurotus ostreatus (strain PC15) TaxID=1137138 RepID=A0A067NG53_PLEO1|nr:hypothetical protein PLEOSDRAFT_1066313 [Pleurotus ostreatus PC15]